MEYFLTLTSYTSSQTRATKLDGNNEHRVALSYHSAATILHSYFSLMVALTIRSVKILGKGETCFPALFISAHLTAM